MDAILEWLNQRPEGCKVLSVKSYEALSEVVITVKQEEKEDERAFPDPVKNRIK